MKNKNGILFPKAHNYASIPAYFDDFLKLNKERDTKFSHRFLAKKLSWPISYLSELSKGRKNLSLQRALQFSKVAAFSSIDTERLVRLALADGSEPLVREHYKKLLQTSVSDYKKANSQYPEIMNDIRFGAVFATLIWGRRLLSYEELNQLLYTFNKKVDRKMYEDILFQLEHFKIIKKTDNGGIEILTYDLDRDLFNKDINDQDQVMAIHRTYSENFIEFTRQFKTPCFYNSGFVEIPRAEFSEIAKKFLELRNWLLNYSLEIQKQEKEKVSSTLVFQFDMNFFPIMDRKEADKL